MENSPLDRLAPELRNNIYELVFSKSDRVPIDPRKKHTEHPLTRTCRQIRKESLLVFYNHSEFEVIVDVVLSTEDYKCDMYYIEVATKWLNSLKRGQAKAISHIAIHFRLEDAETERPWIPLDDLAQLASGGLSQLRQTLLSSGIRPEAIKCHARGYEKMPLDTRVLRDLGVSKGWYEEWMGGHNELMAYVSPTRDQRLQHLYHLAAMLNIFMESGSVAAAAYVQTC